MIAIVGNKLARPIIVTFIVMPIPPPHQTKPEGTLYILLSANRETIEADKLLLAQSGKGAVAGEAEIQPDGIARLRGLPEPTALEGKVEHGLGYVPIHCSYSRQNGIVFCQVTINAKVASMPKPGTLLS